MLLPQDTTDIIKVTNKGPKGVGTLKNTEKDEIFFHPVIAITPDKVPLGTISVQLWKRSEQSIRAERRDKPIEEKESYCWLEGYQAACDILLMPYQHKVSASSGGDIVKFLSPMKLFEYLACGRAILSSDLPVLREVLNSQNAILLPADDSAAWVAAIRELKANPEKRAALAAQAQADASDYSWEARAEQIMREAC